MNTKPRAKKFRIRRNTAGGSDPMRRITGDGVAPDANPVQQPTPRPAPMQGDQLFAPTSADDGFGKEPFPNSAAAQKRAAAQPVPTEQAELTPAKSVDEVIADIRKEGLTGRQLRMARRIAQKNGLAPTSDFDAVRLLRERGVDPFERANSLELVPNGTVAAPASANIPQTMPKPQLPSTEVITEDKRAQEIIKMQRDIVRRRQKKTMQLFARLAFFVLLPTIIAGYYFFTIATPMYSTKSEIVIKTAQNPAAAAGGLGGLMSGSPLATSQDSITVQGYLGSLEAMLRLEQDVGFISHFSQPDIDPLTRLEPDATKEEAHKLYRKKVLISYDPTEGIIKMEVIAADPQVAKEFAERLIFYAEERVDILTQRVRDDQMAGAMESFEDSEAKMLAAQQKLQDLQEQLGVIDAQSENTLIIGQISNLESMLIEKELSLAQLLDNPRPNQPRVDGTRRDIDRLNEQITLLRGRISQGDGGGESIAGINARIQVAQTELATRTLMMQTALQSLETARVEANRQTRYLENSVAPIAPDTAAYPRSFENTILALLIFAGIYLMISLTTSILREQVSS